MRLTLRTLLAYEHGLLNDQQAAEIAQKIEQSPFVLQLLRHLKDRAARPEIVPLALDARGIASLEKVTGYLDYVLSADDVVKLENECFASDRLLAEVANCHDVLAQWLTSPAPLEPALRQQLYALLPDGLPAIEQSQDEVAIELPEFTFHSKAPAKPVAQIKPPTEPPAKKRSLAGTAWRLLALSACVMGLVAFVVMNRGRVEEMVARHWQQKISEPEPQDVPAMTSPPHLADALLEEPRSQEFLAQAAPLAKPPTQLPASAEPNAPSEVAVTAFHTPIPAEVGQLPGVAPVGSTQISSVLGAFYQSSAQADWNVLTPRAVRAGRLVVSIHGHGQLQRQGISLEVGPVSDLSWNDEGELDLRYGRLDIKLSPGQTMQLRAAGQDLAVTAKEQAVHLHLKTVAFAPLGIDFASTEMNQELLIEGGSGEAHLVLSSCRGPFSLGAQQKIAAHRDRGVRGLNTFVFKPIGQSSAEIAAWNESLQTEPDLLAQLEKGLTSPVAEIQAASAIALGQLGKWELLTGIWGQWENNPSLQAPIREFRELIAQDSALAAQLKASLTKKSPQHGPLIYRLVCGFSSDQLNEATRAQLETLLRHPEPAVRVWTQFQLGGSVASTPRHWN
ncbi:hypothetical protein DTL42_24330 [Bremerella cremea]|uniref:Uncharacterized protein n=2 Tax=Bremerella cremea TaxID=1031537 RepID=A0A368KME4_9BACT|nr:hypothetical protein DTL42_24330 [Bremerella cremea]